MSQNEYSNRLTEDQRVVDGHIDDQAGQGSDEGDAHRAPAAQCRHEDAVEDEQGECVLQEGQILHAGGDDGFIGGEQV